MTTDQITIFVILAIALLLFAWGKWRHDMVAMFALIICVLVGLVEPDKMFIGFAHPAVITVAAVLVLSHGLKNAGAVDMISAKLEPISSNQFLHISSLTIIVTVASAFMNNVGALALMLPVAIATSKLHNRSPAIVLMPMAFGSILGGMTTMIGTPPNIIISSLREGADNSFMMFDFSPVGVPVALLGVLFVITIGWRLLPKERLNNNASDNLLEVGKYVLELKITEKSSLVSQGMKSLKMDDNWSLHIVGVSRYKQPAHKILQGYVFKKDDILIVHGKAEDVRPMMDEYSLELQNSKGVPFEDVRPQDINLFEAIITARSKLADKYAIDLRRWTFGVISLLGISRAGRIIKTRLHKTAFKIGDILLLEAKKEQIENDANNLGLLPLSDRDLTLRNKTQTFMALGIFIFVIALGVMKVLPLFVSFLIGIFGFIVFNMLSVRQLYDEIDWPVIVLIAAMIPVGQALDNTGATGYIASNIVEITSHWQTIWILTLVLVVTMFLSDIINNAATVLVMAPISINIANNLNFSSDAFLMAVAVGASCAFLTPIGHQSNTLVLGPGGYKFSDYWRMGLPLEIIIIFISVPMIMWVWS
ncbi:MAG: SLC13 family permease [Gammaproteobacteria bacterium]|nr:MAG: SLC13 family permease [Gammaproteobacteria bacterium]